MHSLLYLIVKLDDYIINDYETKEECVESIADSTMSNMVDNNEGFDWYSVTDTVPYAMVEVAIREAIEEHIADTTGWIHTIRNYLATHSDEKLARDGVWEFRFTCLRIGKYAGSDVPVYSADRHGCYDSIQTPGELESFLNDSKEMERWVAMVDAHS